MGPRPHQQPTFGAHFRTSRLTFPALITLETLVHQIVVPTGDKIRRYIHLGIAALHAVGFPELIEAVMPDHFSVKWALCDRIKRPDQGQSAVHLLHIDLLPGHILQGAVANPHEIHGILQLQYTVVAQMAVVILLIGYWYQRLGIRTAESSRQNLGETRVGNPKGTDISVAPGLRSEPLLGVVTIIFFIDINERTLF